MWNKVANIYAGNGGSLNFTYATRVAGAGGAAYGILIPFSRSTVINSRTVFFIPSLRANTISNVCALSFFLSFVRLIRYFQTRSGLGGVSQFNATLYNGTIGDNLAIYPFKGTEQE